MKNLLYVFVNEFLSTAQISETTMTTLVELWIVVVLLAFALSSSEDF